jgi:Flagellar biosynthesis pathway, component FliP
MRKNKTTLMFLVLFSILLFATLKAYAAPETIPIPNINISVDDAQTPKDYVDNIKLLITLTILSLLPSFLVMMTSFTRLIVVLGFVRTAIGTQQAPPNQVLVGLALFLTIFIMAPTYTTINKEAIQPFLKNTINQEQAIGKSLNSYKTVYVKANKRKRFRFIFRYSKSR